jgi:hypothetical protein
MELKNPVAVDKELKDILNDGPHDLQDLQELEGEEGAQFTSTLDIINLRAIQQSKIFKMKLDVVPYNKMKEF